MTERVRRINEKKGSAMTKLLLIRHGQSVANLEEIFAGITDTPLSELGLTQAKKTAAYLTENYRIDAVAASDLSRARDTAQLVAQKLGLPLEIEPGVREIDGGKWEGVTFEEMKLWPQAFHDWMQDIGNAVCPEGESTLALQKRVVAALEALACRHEGQTVVVGSHATPILAAMCHCLKLSADEMRQVHFVPNASVTTLIWEDGRLRLEQAGYDAHLGALSTSLPEDF